MINFYSNVDTKKDLRFNRWSLLHTFRAEDLKSGQELKCPKCVQKLIRHLILIMDKLVCMSMASSENFSWHLQFKNKTPKSLEFWYFCIMGLGLQIPTSTNFIFMLAFLHYYSSQKYINLHFKISRSKKRFQNILTYLGQCHT